MGSFDYTCAVSQLPIQYGDKVRYMLITSNPYNQNSWFPRTFPICASYNDYGSIEDVQDKIMQDLWMEGFQKDLVSIGTGENTVHDVPTSKDMSFEEMLAALHSERLLVTSDLSLNNKDKKYIPKGVPTLKRIRKILQKNNFTVLKTGYIESGYLINKIRYGEIRIRYSACGDTVGTDFEKLQLLQPILNKKYVTALVAGRGLDKVELLVFIKPEMHNYGNSNSYHIKPLRVNHLMIREDVWQKLLTLPIEDEDNSQEYTIQNYKEKVYDLYSKSLEILSTEKNITDSYSLGIHLQIKYNAYLLTKSEIPYIIGLGEHWILLCNKHLPFEQVKATLDSIAEFVYIWRVLMTIRWYCRPSCSSGPQYGDWEAHYSYINAISDVAKKEVIKLRKKQFEYEINRKKLLKQK